MATDRKIRVRCVKCGAERDASLKEKPICEDCRMPMLPVHVVYKRRDDGESPL
jgi:hypothetical protein